MASRPVFGSETLRPSPVRLTRPRVRPSGVGCSAPGWRTLARSGGPARLSRAASSR